MKHLVYCCILLMFGRANAREISFNQDIRGILADRCFACHGPDAAAREADLRLDREELAKAPIEEGGDTPIVAGNPDASSIMHRILSDDPDERMPPLKSKLSLSKKEIHLLRQWIKEGAHWERHWAFIPPENAPLPTVSNKKWPRNAIDHFVLARLEAEKLTPSEEADRAHLLRRLSFDLTGLPPTIAELDAFLADPSDAAYERAVDRLIASPAFGERLALEWLDVARYGDTDGLFEDHARSIYPWRDWLVNAFNDNLPYKDFITWQLAGDLLPEASTPQKIATGFLRNNTTSNEGGIIDEDYRIKYLVDRINTTSTAFLGLTMECAQCHDHKFDPMTQREYFQFGGFFNSLVGNGNTKGTSAPTLKMLPPEKEKRLAQITEEITAIDTALKTSPPELESDFEQWLTELEQPVQWQQPEIISDTSEHVAETQRPKPSNIKGRYIRIALPKDQTGFLTMSEVEVFSGGRNIARAGKASSSSVSHRSPAAKAIDGNNNGTFASCSCTAEERDAWWELDLGEVIDIDHILVYNRNDCCPERLNNISVHLLDEARNPTSEHALGVAPYRTVFTLNPDAPEPKPVKNAYEITLAATGSISALQFSSKKPGTVESLIAEVLTKAKPRPLKIIGNGKFKSRADHPAIVGLEKPLTLAEGEQLKLKITGDPFTVSITADVTAAERAKIPTGREKRLAHYRGTWPGFSEQRTKKDALGKEKTTIEKSSVVSMIANDQAKMRPTYVLMRGEYDKPGEQVEPSAPTSIMAYSTNAPPNRLSLATWMVDPQHPLTARVAVNRYWQMIFGQGIVRTSEDFGTQGERPSHPALLDHLAVEFVESNWDVKKLIRKIVTSTTYRQASVQTAAIAERDPLNRLISHAPRQRLTAEFVRDHALSVSGLLVDKRGGPGVQPYQPAVLFGRNAIGSSNASFKQGAGDDLYRRSLYTYWKRQIPAANMRILGADGRTACRTRREQTNTPLQALVLLNDPQFIEAARVLAERMIKEGGATPRERIAYAFRLATSRNASDAERAILQAEYDDRLRSFQADAAATTAFLAGGGAHKADAAINPAELAAYAAVAAVILNLDESISKS